MNKVNFLLVGAFVFLLGSLVLTIHSNLDAHPDSNCPGGSQDCNTHWHKVCRCTAFWCEGEENFDFENPTFGCWYGVEYTLKEEWFRENPGGSCDSTTDPREIESSCDDPGDDDGSTWGRDCIGWC